MTTGPRIKTLLLAVLATLMCAISATASTDFANEKLRYKVMYKWGLIHKVAGHASVELKTNASTYTAIVTARTEPWADKIYSLRDTLKTVMDRKTLAPRHYSIHAHEDGKFKSDVIDFKHVGDKFTAECVRTRRGKSDTIAVVTKTHLEAQGKTADFLSAFYYLRSLNFDTMLPGTQTTINVFSGKRKELLRFTFRGIESIKVDGRRQNAYKVQFTFTSDGKKETSDPITAWISMDGARTPLQIEGKLKVGKILCILEQ